MRLGGDEEPVLRQHLMEKLEPLCEAEPAVLAEYVIALLKNDASMDELRANCVSELQDFLQENTEVR